VLIPTYGRAEKLARCLRGLADQTMDATRFEVIVGFDGADEAGASLAARVWRENAGRAELRVLECAREGYTLVRNRMLSAGRGRIMVSLNDDVRPEPDFLNVHVREHERRRASGAGPAIVVGHSPYARREEETLLDRLVRRTSMVFFYDVMNRAACAPGYDPDRDWGFRHCFGLNFSVDAACVREVGGFFARPHLYGYDDIELGFRLAARFEMPVLYRPSALAEHEHFYQPHDLIERERKLGMAAWAFTGANPAFGLACFGRDLCSGAEVAYSREFVARERDAAERVRADFLNHGHLPGNAVDGPHEQQMLELIAQQFVLLKRWEWRSGLLFAAGLEAPRA